MLVVRTVTTGAYRVRVKIISITFQELRYLTVISIKYRIHVILRTGTERLASFD
jgi:hypothetical protein